MVAAAIPIQKLRYNAKAGRWIGPGGGFLSKADVSGIVTQERNRLESEMVRSTNRLIRGRITVEQWQRQLIQSQKSSNLRAMVAGAGGIKALNRNPRNSVYLRQHRQQQQQFAEGLADLTLKIQNGERTAGQVIGWVKYQASNVHQSFNESEYLTKLVIQGHNEFKRSLDPSAKHCPDCPAHSTNGQWIPIEEGVPVGVLCRCKGRCRCKVQTRFNPEAALGLLGQTTLRDKLRQHQDAIANPF